MIQAFRGSEDVVMTPGAFMLINGIATLIVVKVGFQMDVPGQVLGIGGAFYFWFSLYLHREWFLWDSDICRMSDSTLSAVLSEWESRGPFGRNTPEIGRLMHSNNLRKKARGARRLANIYEEFVRREPESESVVRMRRLEGQHRWEARANDLERQLGA